MMLEDENVMKAQVDACVIEKARDWCKVELNGVMKR